MDLTVAAQLDGTSLQRAIETESRGKEVDEFIQLLTEETNEVRARAQDFATTLTGEWKAISEDLARYAARAVGDWALQKLTMRRDDDGRWTITTWCEATPQGQVRSRHETIEATCVAAKQLCARAGTTAEQRHVIEEEGEASFPGGGALITTNWKPQMQVSADGTVTITDFATRATLAPSIEEAANIAIKRRWIPADGRKGLERDLERSQREAIIEAERTKGRNNRL